MKFRTQSISLASIALLATGATLLGVAPASYPEVTTAQDPAALDFTIGATKQMKGLAWMAGTWDVNLEMTSPDGQSMTQQVTSTIRQELSNCFLVESLGYDIGGMTLHAIGYRSYDQFRKSWRIVWFDDVLGLADVYEGKQEGDAIVATNLRVNTTVPSLTGEFANGRFTQTRISDDKFTITWEYSTDGGKSWTRAGRSTYTRR